MALPTRRQNLGASAALGSESCSIGWSGLLIWESVSLYVIEHQLDKFGLKGTVKSARGAYEALMAEVIARVMRGEPTLYYDWGPSWVMGKLVPGKDVVWLPTPFDSRCPRT